MERRFALKLFILLASLVWGMNSHAQDKSAQFGVMYGLSVPDTANVVPHHMFGVKGAAFIRDSLTLGGYYLVTGASEGGSGNKFDYSIHGIETTLSSKGTFIGLRMGITKLHQLDTTTGTKYIMSPYHYGIVVGHDYSITSWMTLGFEGAYIHVEKSKSTQGGNTYNLDSFNMINFMVTSQLRF